MVAVVVFGTAKGDFFVPVGEGGAQVPKPQLGKVASLLSRVSVHYGPYPSTQSQRGFTDSDQCVVASS